MTLFSHKESHTTTLTIRGMANYCLYNQFDVHTCNNKKSELSIKTSTLVTQIKGKKMKVAIVHSRK